MYAKRSLRTIRERFFSGGNAPPVANRRAAIRIISSTSRGILRARWAVPHRNDDSKPTSMSRVRCADDQMLVDWVSVEADPLDTESTDTHGA